ncbi:MAG: hypothetical protein ACR2PL_04930, partial [Dehalococcoidia bacterium]
DTPWYCGSGETGEHISEVKFERPPVPDTKTNDAGVSAEGKRANQPSAFTTEAKSKEGCDDKRTCRSRRHKGT